VRAQSGTDTGNRNNCFQRDDSLYAKIRVRTKS
jgi:hypothetical protein